MGFVDLSMWPASTSSMDGYVLILIIVLSGSYSQLLTRLTRGTYYDGKKPSSTWKALLIYQCISQWREYQDLIGQTCPVQIFQSTQCVCVCVCVCVYTKSQSCLTLCGPMDCGPQDSSVHGISQARILEWVTVSFSGDLPNPGIESMSPPLADGFFTTEQPRKPLDCLIF